MRRNRSGASFGKDRAAGEQPAKGKEQEARLAESDVPENARGFVARVLAERAARRIVHQIDQTAVIGLLELMNRFSDEQMQIEFPAQRTQLAAFSAIQDRFAYADGAREIR